MQSPRIFIAIPAMDELHTLPHTLQDLVRQNIQAPFELYVCVNQPEAYWEDDKKREICANNQQLLSFLEGYKELPLHVIDRASKGCGWTPKKLGVGWARKTLFDAVMAVADDRDILISLDADTRIREGYLHSIADNFARHPSLTAISIPYYHPLMGREENDRAVLRYELYMRSYLINLYHIQSPYAFTAVGSAMAMRVGALRKIGGITPLKSGEDFYLIQKFRKMAPISNWNAEMVYPSARFSSRVFFGTGPALIKGNNGQWDSYPIYPHTLFATIEQTYRQLDQLFQHDIQTDFLDFLQQQFKDNKLWKSIRHNVKDLAHFEQGFHEKADGLRILQYLRQRISSDHTDEQNLLLNLQHWFPERVPDWFDEGLTFQQMSITQLDTLRNILFEAETALRIQEGGV